MAFNGTGSNVTSLNASNISSGTLAVANGGTGVTSAGTSGNVLTSDGSAWVSQAISAGGDYVMNVYTAPGTWTKPAGLKALKVTVVGGGGAGKGGSGVGGGGGGTSIEYYDAPAIPGPQPYTVGSGGAAVTSNNNGNPGGTSSFGGPVAFLSATGGSGGSPGAGGLGSNGNANFYGDYGTPSIGGGSFMGGLRNYTGPEGNNGNTYGGGGTSNPPGNPTQGGAGVAGVIIVEEFY